MHRLARAYDSLICTKTGYFMSRLDYPTHTTKRCDQQTSMTSPYTGLEIKPSVSLESLHNMSLNNDVWEVNYLVTNAK